MRQGLCSSPGACRDDHERVLNFNVFNPGISDFRPFFIAEGNPLWAYEEMSAGCPWDICFFILFINTREPCVLRPPLKMENFGRPEKDATSGRMTVDG